MYIFLSLESQLNRVENVETQAQFCDRLKIDTYNDALLKSTCKYFVKLFKLSKQQCGNDFSTGGFKCCDS
ncbi:hypothetical protein PVBG_05863 [Plasmodium vivax Brazil I]|uniref:Uncharacterized protein n=1 Tax=Plasmodium vivax (strain Brazil I) TaxID=1033975 RepID=A0A0J9T165_PLAV1|nr:hypothetical protein PVBG_05863 [Plasmodium vivax Brazil I]